MYKLYNEDSYDRILKIDDNTIDAIITDPPYNISRENNFHTMGRSGIDFGDWDKGFDQEKWIDIVSSKIKKGGNIVIFNDWKNFTIITNALQKNDFDIKDLLRWVKDNPMPRNIERRFVTDYEFAIWAVKNGGKWTFNKISETYERPEIKGSLLAKSEKTGHKTQKPEYVMNWIIERLTKPNDLILDPFMGSGSTGISAIKLGRRFIGIEKCPESFGYAVNRFNHLTEIK